LLDETSAALAEVDLGDPVIAPVPDVTTTRSAVPYWTSERTGDGWVRVRRGTTGTSSLTLSDGWTVENRADDTVYELREGDPTSAAMRRRLSQAFHGDGVAVVIDYTSAMTCDHDSYTITHRAEISLDGELHFREETTNVVPRAL
jgi:hypothetical protein